MDLGDGIVGVALVAFVAGLRHGFDIDHIAAIADITSAQTTKRRSLELATFYAAGHALALIALGSLAVIWGKRIPDGFDSAMGRVIGATLIALGIYVVVSMVRFGRDFTLKGRWMLVLAGSRRALSWIQRRRPEPIVIEHAHEHSSAGHHHDEHGGEELLVAAPATAISLATKTHMHTHRHVVTSAVDPFAEYGKKATFFVGAIHGIGAETPSQILLLTTAAGIAGSAAGFVVLAAFVAGLFVGNSVLAVASTFGFARRGRLKTLYMGLAGVTASISIYVGFLYLIQRVDLLPTLLGG